MAPKHKSIEYMDNWIKVVKFSMYALSIANNYKKFLSLTFDGWLYVR